MFGHECLAFFFWHLLVNRFYWLLIWVDELSYNSKVVTGCSNNVILANHRSSLAFSSKTWHWVITYEYSWSRLPVRFHLDPLYPFRVSLSYNFIWSPWIERSCLWLRKSLLVKEIMHYISETIICQDFFFSRPSRIEIEISNYNRVIPKIFILRLTLIFFCRDLLLQ